MSRFLILLCLAVCLPAIARAQSLAWEVCRGSLIDGAPTLADCRPLEGPIDPQGREIWIRADVPPPGDDALRALFLGGVASSEAWFNGRKLGANGRPGSNARAEIPGRYQATFTIPDSAWRPTGGTLVVRLSSFHGGVRFAWPMSGVVVAPYPLPSRAPLLAVTFVAAGALFAATFGFGVIHALRRTSSSLILAAMSAVAGLQAVVESLRSLFAYPYPLHAWRMGTILTLAAAFATLLVAYVAGRFLPRRRNAVVGLALAAMTVSAFAPGFDQKIGYALVAGVVLAGAAAIAGVRARKPGAGAVLAYLAAFLTLAVAFPEWLADLSYFLLAAALVLPLLMAEVIRLGRDDQGREAALIRAASQPDRLTVASAGGVELVPTASILAVVGADDYVELRLIGGRRLLHAERLERLAERLPSNFLRVHRSAIANLARVKRLERDGDRWRLHLDEGAPVAVSRSRLAPLRDALDTNPSPKSK